MDRIEKLVKEYSSKKLKEIIEQQSFSYSEKFVDYAKDELIRRGESFQFNPVLEKEVINMNDDDLKNIVEKDWNNYHLEYLEIAREEYIKRNFRNETGYEEQETEKEAVVEDEQGTDTPKRYSALRIMR